MPSELETKCIEAYCGLQEALEGVTEDEAEAFRLDSWPHHDYWSGEDGSIGGLVFHLAAWKLAYAEGLETGTWGDEKAAQPPDDSWTGRLQWLAAQQETLLAALRRLEAEEMASLLIDDRPYVLSAVIEEMTVHDTYHAAQINYLRQRYLAEHPGAAA